MDFQGAGLGKIKRKKRQVPIQHVSLINGADVVKLKKNLIA